MMIIFNILALFRLSYIGDLGETTHWVVLHSFALGFHFTYWLEEVKSKNE
jgi:hypothetical protein